MSHLKPSTSTTFMQNTLHHAVQIGSYQQVKQILETTGNVDQKRGVSGETALHLAAKGGNLSIVQLLLTYRANPNISDVFSKTPLHYASREGKSDIVKALLDNGANVNAQTKVKFFCRHHINHSTCFYFF
jgi:ankyrin repeat protein